MQTPAGKSRRKMRPAKQDNAGASCPPGLTASSSETGGGERRAGKEAASPRSHATPRKPPRGPVQARKQLAFGGEKVCGSAAALLASLGDEGSMDEEEW